jgi:hypothetical protein
LNSLQLSHRHPHLTATFTADDAATAVIAPAATATMQIPSTQLSLASAIAAATAIVAAVAVAFAAAITVASAVTIAAASTDVSASTRSVSPDAWACGDDSLARRDTLELKAEAW